MSHHGNDEDEVRRLNSAMREVFGEFPNGRLNAYDQGAENHQAGEGDWAARAAAAVRAYDEWMPVRLGDTVATGDGTALFRRLTFGTLAELSMLGHPQRLDEHRSAPP